MRIQLPLNFEVFYKEPKKASWKSAYLLTDYGYDVPEIAAEDTELAFRLGEYPDNTEASEHSDRLKPFRIVDAAADVRLYNGSFYMARYPAEDMQAIFADPPVQEEDHYFPESRSPLFGFHSHTRMDDEPAEKTWRIGFHAPTDLRTEADLSASLGYEVKRFTSYEREHRAVADAIMENFIIVAGTVYERVTEPVLKLYDYGPNITLVIDEIAPTIKRAQQHHNRDRHLTAHVFGIDEFDRAITFATTFAKQTKKRFRNLAVVEFVAPWHVTYRGENASLYRFAREAYSRLCLPRNEGGYGDRASIMSLMTREAGLALYDLAMAVEQHAETSPALVRAVRNLLNVVDRQDVIEDLFDNAALDRQYGHYYSRKSEASRNAIRQRLEGRIDTVSDQLKDLRRALTIFDDKIESKLDWTKSMLDIDPTFKGPCRYFEVTNYRLALEYSEKLGTDITGAAEDAALQRGRLFVVDNFVDDRPIGAFYVSNSSDPGTGPVFFSRPGEMMDKSHAKVIEQMIKGGRLNENAIADELEGLGL